MKTIYHNASVYTGVLPLQEAFGVEDDRFFFVGTNEEARKQQADSFVRQSLEGVGGCSGLERSATQNIGTGSFYGFCNVKDLFFGFYGTRTCNHSKMTAAEFCRTGRDNAVGRMELAVCLLERFRHSLYCVYNFKTGKQLYIYAACVTNQSENCYFLSVRYMNI